MKAIKDCEWEVHIEYEHCNRLYSFYTFTNNAGITGLEGQDYKSKQSAKRNWERFVKLNKIKKWKYV